MLYWEYYLMGIIVLPGILFAIWAQVKVSSTYSKYGKVLGSKGMTGAEVVSKMLAVKGITNVSVTQISGTLTDHYNPLNKVISLSRDVYTGTTIADLGVAAHECGHAIQHAEKYGFFTFRNIVAVATNISSKLLWPIIVLGLFLGFAVESPAGKFVLIAGVTLFGLSFLFSLITLPVELNASKRAINALVDVGALDDMEVIGAKQVLKAAALTYVAAVLVSLLELLRFIIIFARRDD